jgi:hypothetical protein
LELNVILIFIISISDVSLTYLLPLDKIGQRCCFGVHASRQMH